MKNIALFSLLFCAGSLMAQSNGPAHVIKTNPLGLLLGQYQLGYEHALSDQFSVQMSAGMIVGELTAYDSTSFESVLLLFAKLFKFPTHFYSHIKLSQQLSEAKNVGGKT